MRNVYDCVWAFEKLLDKEYRLILGRKNVAVEFLYEYGTSVLWGVEGR